MHMSSDSVNMISPIGSTLIARFMGPTWGLPGADRTQVGPMLASWTLLSGYTRILNKRITPEPLIHVVIILSFQDILCNFLGMEIYLSVLNMSAFYFKHCPLLVCDLNRTPNCYGKTWRFLCPFFRNLHLRENLARDCFTSTVSTVTNSVQNIFTHLRHCDK